MSLRTVFLCGDRSRYGRAHLEALLSASVELVAIVIADDARWSRFRRSLSGRVYFPPRANPSAGRRPKSAARRLKSAVRAVLPEPVLRAIGRAPQQEFEPLEQVAARHGIPVIVANDVHAGDCLEALRALRPELFVSAAYPQIFKSALLELPARGCVNFHPSLLPRFRGAHPHYWAIATGAAASGVSAHFMTPNIDDGDLIAQLEFPIAQYRYTELYDRIVAETPALVARVDAFFQDPSARAVPQDPSQVSMYRNDREIHHRVFWSLHTAEEIGNLARTECAFCYFRNDRVGLLQLSAEPSNRNLTNEVRVEPGTIVDLHKEGVVVKTQDSCVSIQLFSAGEKTSPFAQWIEKHRPEVGEQFH
jgi:methionyl-tRNA formyltransferase